MKKLILATGITGTILFLVSIYAFLFSGNLFKPVAYGFLTVTVVFFILMIITKTKEERERRRKAGRF